MSERAVRKERTGWRDQALSERHREWGWNCPAADLDFLMVEYNVGRPVGLIEYKHYNAKMPDMAHPTYRALGELAKMAQLPFMLAFYWPDVWAFRVRPLNQLAATRFDWKFMLTEREYVSTLYEMRNMKLAETLNRILKDELPLEVPK